MIPKAGRCYGSKFISSFACVCAAAMLFFATTGRAQTCVSSKSSAWANKAFTSQSGTFHITYDATPSSSSMDAVSGLSSGATSNVSSLATSVRFSSAGIIDIRNGSSFTAANRVTFVAGTVHHIILDVNLSNHTYSASVMVNSRTTTLGTNVAFRNEAAGVKSLSNLAVLAAVGTLNICNISVSGSSTPTSSLIASVSSLNFGSVPVATSSDQNITLTNAGTSSVTISKVTVAGASYTASGGAAGLTLSANQTATVRATFAPATTGTLTGSISVASNATNSPASVSLTGIGVTATAHSVKLAWTNSTSTVSGYNVYSSSTSGGPYTKLDSTLIPGTTYTHTSVQSGHSYYYVVTSVNSSGQESSRSSEVRATVP